MLKGVLSTRFQQDFNKISTRIPTSAGGFCQENQRRRGNMAEVIEWYYTIYRNSDDRILCFDAPLK